MLWNVSSIIGGRVAVPAASGTWDLHHIRSARSSAMLCGKETGSVGMEKTRELPESAHNARNPQQGEVGRLLARRNTCRTRGSLHLDACSVKSVSCGAGGIGSSRVEVTTRADGEVRVLMMKDNNKVEGDSWQRGSGAFAPGSDSPDQQNMIRDQTNAVR